MSIKKKYIKKCKSLPLFVNSSAVRDDTATLGCLHWRCSLIAVPLPRNARWASEFATRYAASFSMRHSKTLGTLGFEPFQRRTRSLFFAGFAVVVFFFPHQRISAVDVINDVNESLEPHSDALAATSSSGTVLCRILKQFFFLSFALFLLNFTWCSATSHLVFLRGRNKFNSFKNRIAEDLK